MILKHGLSSGAWLQKLFVDNITEGILDTWVDSITKITTAYHELTNTCGQSHSDERLWKIERERERERGKGFEQLSTLDR
jgi:hypothetical protein